MSALLLDMAYWYETGVCGPLSPFGYVYSGRLLNKLHRILRHCKLIE